MSRPLAPLLLLLVAVVACSAPTREAPPPPVEAFSPEPAVDTAPTIALRGRGDGLERVTVDVVATNVADVQGVAFRLSWDPETLAFLGADGSSAFTRNAIRLAKEGSPGQLAVAWTERGAPRGIDATRVTVLGTVTFAVRDPSRATAIAFRPDRSTVMDRNGNSVAVTWRGGRVASR